MYGRNQHNIVKQLSSNYKNQENNVKDMQNISANTHMERCSTSSLAIREVQIRIQ